MMMPDSELRRLLRMPLQAFGKETSSGPPGEAFAGAGIVLKAKRIPASRLRICFSPAHDISHLLHTALGLAQQEDRRPAPEPPDLRGREFRRMLRTWTPQSHVDVAVHPANLRFLPPDEEIVVGGWTLGAKPDNAVSLAVSLAMLAAPLSRDRVPQVIKALVAHLAKAELHGAARHMHQKRLSRNALSTSPSGGPAGPQPAAPPGRVPATARRQFRGPNLRPALYRVLPVRRNLHFAAA